MNETGVNISPVLTNFTLNYIAMAKVKLSQVKQPERCKYEINVHYKVFPLDRNGNTYHRVKICLTVNGEFVEYDSGVTYGYGEAYKQTALEWLIENVQLTGKYETERKNTIKNGDSAGYFFRQLRESKYLKITFTPVDYLTRKK